MDGHLLGNSLTESRDNRQEGKGKKTSVGVEYAHLVWEGENGVMNVSKNSGLFHLSVCCIHVSIFDVVPAQSIVNTPLIKGSTKHHSLDCVIEEHSVLWHNSHGLPEAGLAVTFHVLPTKCDLSLLHVKHSDQQFCHCGLAASRAESVFVISFQDSIFPTPSHECCRCASFYLEGHIPRKELVEV